MASQQSVHQICDSFVDEYAVADPVAATMLGISGYDDQLTDYSPEGYAARASIARHALRAAEAAESADDGTRTAKAVFTERIGLELEIHEAGLDLASLNVISSPLQQLRMVFDLVPTDTAEQWATIAARLAKVPAALVGARTSLLAAADKGKVSALRQVTKVAEQAETWAGLHGQGGFFTTLVSGAKGVAEELRGELDRQARAAQEAYAEFAGFLRADLASRAPTKDAVGEDVYRLWSRYFTGAALDLREAYEWGWAEFSRIEAEMVKVAGRIKPGATLAETAAALDANERYLVRGKDAFEEWMQGLSD
ncbi:MAG: DUF885 domain-containing protein, partial [Steroidobacteraceae bacterium]